MNTYLTGPEEKEYFEKVKETIAHLWGGTKEAKNKVADPLETIKDKFTAEKQTVA